MTTVKELIDVLVELPPYTKVQVLREVVYYAYETGTEWVDLDPDLNMSNNFDVLGDTVYFGER